MTAGIVTPVEIGRRKKCLLFVPLRVVGIRKNGGGPKPAETHCVRGGDEKIPETKFFKRSLDGPRFSPAEGCLDLYDLL